jgi:hypothetical protein
MIVGGMALKKSYIIQEGVRSLQIDQQLGKEWFGHAV